MIFVILLFIIRARQPFIQNFLNISHNALLEPHDFCLIYFSQWHWILFDCGLFFLTFFLMKFFWKELWCFKVKESMFFAEQKKLWWVRVRKRKKNAFFVTFILFKRNLFNICVLSHCIMLNKLSEHIYFYTSKTITLYTFVACFQNLGKPSVFP